MKSFFLANSFILAVGLSGFAMPDLPLPVAPFTAERASEYQAEWAEALDLPLELENSLGMKLRLIPPGRFTAGSNGSTDRITLAKPYYIGVTEVTLGQYRQFRAGHQIEGAEAEFNHDDRPAAMVSWEDAREFCNWLSSRPRERQAGRVYSLPTNARWEWAARAGTTSSRYYGDDTKDRDQGLTEHAWYNHTYTPNPKAESGNRGRQQVARLKPNPWGLFDLYGNVWEWCDDRRIDEKTGETREPLYRGGGWRSGGSHCNSFAHDPANPKHRSDHVGFRIVCELPTTQK